MTKINLTGSIISTIHKAKHKLTSGEIVKAIKQLDPDANPSSIRRILTRLTRNSNYSIIRTVTKPYLYYYSKSEPKEQIPYELDSFFNPVESLFIHRIMIMIRDILIKKDEKIEVTFLNLSNPIRFDFYKNTQSIRIDLKCSGWKKALDYFQFNALIAVIDTVLQLKEISCSRDKMRIINLDLNNDIDFQRIAGANCINVQAFQNLLLTAYNKKEGLRKEAQLSFMDIPVDRMSKQLQRTSRELKIGSVFDKTNTVLNQFIRSHNQGISKLNSVLDYNLNVVQQLDSNFSNYTKDINQIAQFQSQLAINNLILLQRMDTQTDFILDHDSNMKKECDFLVEEIQILKVVSVNQARSESMQTRILHLLKEKNYTLQDLAVALELDYDRIYYHIRKLVDSGKITALKEEWKGRGARKRIYKLKDGS
ncbi:MAG: winged helix-turn-helix transcriptional regulator [Asgard group archaeon]|nr:winged helix-turn-helix transcriptional regulator [Asgard group archaeon]